MKEMWNSIQSVLIIIQMCIFVSYKKLIYNVIIFYNKNYITQDVTYYVIKYQKWMKNKN